MDRSVRHPSAAIYSLPSPTAESVRPVVCCPWQGHSTNLISKVRSPKKPDPISNHLDHRGPGLPKFPSHSLPVLACRLLGVTLPVGVLLAVAAPIRCASKIAALGCRAQRHFARFKNPLVIFPTRSFPTKSDSPAAHHKLQERAGLADSERERETSLGVPRLALRGECCGWGASASRRWRRRGSVGRAPAPPGPRRLPVASSRPSQDPAGRNQPRPRCPVGPPPRRGRPWCGGTS